MDRFKESSGIPITSRVLALVLVVSACGGGSSDPQTHTVSGAISPASAGADATVTLGSKTATADANGGFSFTGVADGSYTATPSKAGATFTPATRSVTVAGSEVTGIDFAAQSAGTDSDNDDLVCDAGEVCGAWPTLGAPNPLTVGNDDVTGLDSWPGSRSPSGRTRLPPPRRAADTGASRI